MEYTETQRRIILISGMAQIRRNSVRLMKKHPVFRTNQCTLSGHRYFIIHRFEMKSNQWQEKGKWKLNVGSSRIKGQPGPQEIWIKVKNN